MRSIDWVMTWAYGFPGSNGHRSQIEKECRWLPELATGLPTSVPVPLAKGRPDHGYPFPWLVYPWLQGTSLDLTTVGQLGCCRRRRRRVRTRT